MSSSPLLLTHAEMVKIDKEHHHARVMGVNRGTLVGRQVLVVDSPCRVLSRLSTFTLTHTGTHLGTSGFQVSRRSGSRLLQRRVNHLTFVRVFSVAAWAPSSKERAIVDVLDDGSCGTHVVKLQGWVGKRPCPCRAALPAGRPSLSLLSCLDWTLQPMNVELAKHMIEHAKRWVRRASASLTGGACSSLAKIEGEVSVTHVCCPPCAGCASGHHLPLLCESARRCAKAGAAGGAAGFLSPSLGWVFGAQQSQLCDTVCRPQLLTSCMPWRAVKRPRLLEQDTAAEPRLSRAILQSQTPRSRCDQPSWLLCYVCPDPSRAPCRVTLMQLACVLPCLLQCQRRRLGLVGRRVSTWVSAPPRLDAASPQVAAPGPPVFSLAFQLWVAATGRCRRRGEHGRRSAHARVGG
jgi:hypothetical protein